MKFPPELSPDSKGQLPTMLIVGNLGAWQKSGRDLPNVAGFHFACVDQLDAEFLADINPDVVLSALVSDLFDAIELSVKLVELGFTGRYRALTEKLPRPDAVIQEIRAGAPGLDFDLLMFGPDGL